MSFWQMDDDWGLPKTLIEQLEPVKRAVYRNQADCMMCFIGPEGFGKTTLETRVAQYFLDNKLSIKRDYAWNAMDCVKKWLDAPVPDKGGPHTLIGLDEAIMGLDALAWQAGTARLFNAIAATIRYKYTISLLAIPRLFLLNNRVREGRLAILFRVYGGVDAEGNVQYGSFDLYNCDQIQRIYKDPRTRRVVYPKTRFSGMPFDGLEGTPIWAEYKVIERVEKQKQNEFMMKWAKMEENKTFNKFKEKGSKGGDLTALESLLNAVDANANV